MIRFSNIYMIVFSIIMMKWVPLNYLLLYMVFPPTCRLGPHVLGARWHLVAGIAVVQLMLGKEGCVVLWAGIFQLIYILVKIPW